MQPIPEPVYTVHHSVARDRSLTVHSRPVPFGADGISVPLTRAEWLYLIGIPGFTPVTPEEEARAWVAARDGVPAGPAVNVDLGGETLPDEAPAASSDPLAPLFEQWRGMDLNTRMSYAIDERLSVEALRALQEFEVKTRNSKKVLAVLHDQIVVRTENRNGEQVNGALLRAAFPMAKEE